MSPKKVLLWSGCGLLLVFLACGGIVGLGAWLVTGTTGGSHFAEDAIEVLRAHPEASEALGPPIRRGGGTIQLRRGLHQSGDASLRVEGSRRKGNLVVRGTRTSPRAPWEYSTFYLDMPSERIDLLDFANGPFRRLGTPQGTEALGEPGEPGEPGPAPPPPPVGHGDDGDD